MRALHIGATVLAVWLASGHVAYRAVYKPRMDGFFAIFIAAVLALVVWGIWA